ncbi:MAG TPA: cysteine desulfurase [Aliidongia sp.]|uniref:aminotransferase class V-fold PLP-dependent enzyme n=1 Tax=Aliidongia sp. TaxID=1914230 RepID=UPI002DDDA0BD|nr:cysteine desulfurase [Aliidongia sp.]HEV2674200.1 cysteine desulfurase [Aliidongia sp.]
MSKDSDLRHVPVSEAPLSRPAFDPRVVKQDFPIFRNNPDVVFLDTAASAQKPQVVIDAVSSFYERDYANVHRGVYGLSQRATDKYEAARETVRRFLNAKTAKEIVFVRGATEAINLVAQTWGLSMLKAGDEVLITELEHHSNIVPWQMLRDRIGIKLVVAPMDATGGLDMAAFEERLSARTRLVAVTHVANALGSVLPVEAIVAKAHAVGAKVLIDGCQAAPRMPVDVQAIGCDFYVFSGHKTYGPTGIGVLWGRFDLLDAMPPWQGGGDMILSVTFEHTDFNEVPHKFEAGTPDITGTHGLAVALDYMEALGRDRILEHEERLTQYGEEALSRIPGVKLLGAGQRRLAVLSFEVDGIHPHDLATILDKHRVAVRAGHHCAQPLMDRLGVPATTRASFGIYNDESDVDALVTAIKAAKELFGR